MQKTLYLLLLLAWSANAHAQQKKALIITIDQYASGTGWWATGARQDGRVLTEGLVHVGFVPANITYLHDSAATYAGIQAAYKKLIQQAHPGDTIWIHHSGHGQCMMDLAPNQDESDGLDESIVPYDAPQKYASGTPPNKYLHLRDDEINAYVQELCKKVGEGGLVVVSLDACHAGSGTRSTYEKHRGRGTDGIIGWDESLPPKASTDYQIGQLPTNAVAYYAAGAQQVSYPYLTKQDTIGSLTLALSRALMQLGVGDDTRHLFQVVRREMSRTAPHQNAEMEGNRSSVMLVGKAASYRRYAVTGTAFGEVVTDGGLLHGLPVGTQVALYPAHVKDTTGQRPLALGQVAEASVLSATIQLGAAAPGMGSLDSTYVWVRQPADGLAKHLREVEFRDSHINCSLDMVVVDAGDTTVQNRTNKHGDSYVRVGERHYFVVKNNGPTTIYFALVDIDPDGTLHVAPGPKTKLGDIGGIDLPPGQSYRTETFPMGEPHGQQTMKLLATKEKVDWYGALVQPERGTTRGGSVGSTINLIKLLPTRELGARPVMVEDENVFSCSLHYLIVPRSN